MLLKSNSHQEIYDKPFSLKCPHCNTVTSLTLISIPHYEYLVRFKPSNIGMAYKCEACNEPIFLKFKVRRYEPRNGFIEIHETYHTVEYPKEEFDFEHLPEIIANDFKEALSCFSIGTYNAFASMCRRTIQSSAMNIGTSGKDKVHN